LSPFEGAKLFLKESNSILTKFSFEQGWRMIKRQKIVKKTIKKDLEKILKKRTKKRSLFSTLPNRPRQRKERYR
jgi:hypothetical protein